MNLKTRFVWEAKDNTITSEMSWCNVLQRAGSDFWETYNFPGTFAHFHFMIFTQERILTIKENLPSSTLIVILFLEQGVEIKSLQPEMRPHPIRIQFLHPCKIFQSGKGGSDYYGTLFPLFQKQNHNQSATW